MPISGKEAVKRLQKHGFKVTRQTGSHIVLSKMTPEGKCVTVVPAHKELRKGTIRSFAKLAGLDASVFGL